MRKILKYVIAFALLFSLSVDVAAGGAYNSSVTNATRKKSAPLWARWEHYVEETSWRKTCEFEENVELLAIAIFCEAGADKQTNDTRFCVGDVILNRVNDARFPNTIAEVLTAPNQYGNFAKTGVVWPEYARYECNKKAVERARETARALLSGTHSRLYGNGYVFQAGFVQGKDGFWQDGVYFGR